MKEMMKRTVAHCKQKAVSKIFSIIFLFAERDESMIISIFIFFRENRFFSGHHFIILLVTNRLIVEKFELGE